MIGQIHSLKMFVGKNYRCFLLVSKGDTFCVKGNNARGLNCAFTASGECYYSPISYRVVFFKFAKKTRQHARFLFRPVINIKNYPACSDNTNRKANYTNYNTKHINHATPVLLHILTKQLNFNIAGLAFKNNCTFATRYANICACLNLRVLECRNSKHNAGNRSRKFSGFFMPYDRVGGEYNTRYREISPAVFASALCQFSNHLVAFKLSFLSNFKGNNMASKAKIPTYTYAKAHDPLWSPAFHNYLVHFYYNCSNKNKLLELFNSGVDVCELSRAVSSFNACKNNQSNTPINNAQVLANPDYVIFGTKNKQAYFCWF